MKVKKIDDKEYVIVNGKYFIYENDKNNFDVYKRSETNNKTISFLWSFRTLKEAIKFVETKTEANI